MTQEEKQLLLKDLLARLLYGVNAEIVDMFGYTGKIHISVDTLLALDKSILLRCKPYLRPMSSMTEEEKEYIKNRWCYEDWNDIYNFLNHYQIDAGDAFGFVDWLNAHHFDYNGLIEKELALEAPEGMYN